MAINANIIDAMNAGCDCTSTRFKQKGEGIEAREYHIDSVALAQLAVMGTHPLLAGNYVRTVDKIIDGIAYTREEMRLVAKSKATGGRGKFECGFIPSDIEVRKMNKVADTTLIHIDAENCPKNLIGTQYQDIVFGDNLMQKKPLYGSDKYQMAMLLAMSEALKTITVGIHEGSDPQTAHFDGILAQIVRNEGGVFYETVKYDFAGMTVDATTPLFVKHGGEKKSFDTIQEFADYVAVVTDLAGDLVYTVIYDTADVVQVTVNKAGYMVGLEVVTEQSDIDWTCATLFEPTVLQNRMAFPESSVKIVNRPINASNFYEEMNSVSDAWELSRDTSYTERSEGRYMAIDPLLLSIAQRNANFNKNTETGCCTLGDPFQNGHYYDWEFVPLEELRGSGLYFLTYKGGSHFLTDILREGLAGMVIGVDDKCENVWMKYEQLANVLITDFNNVVSNVCGSKFAEKVLETTAYMPANIPALCAETLRSCLAPSTNDVARIKFDATDLANFAYESTTIAPYGLTVTGYSWTILGAAGASATLAATQSGLTDLTNATLGFDATLLKLEVTFSDGSTDSTYTPIN